MTIEELLTRKISNEIDIELMKRVMKSTKVSKQGVQGIIDKLVKEQNLKLERELLGGKNKIHGTED
jgi:hypothetical protein